MVLPHKSLANIARCTLESADKTNLSRFLSEVPWPEDAVNRRRYSLDAAADDNPIAVAAASRSSPSMIRCANTWGAGLITWISNRVKISL